MSHLLGALPIADHADDPVWIMGPALNDEELNWNHSCELQALLTEGSDTNLTNICCMPSFDQGKGHNSIEEGVEEITVYPPTALTNLNFESICSNNKYKMAQNLPANSNRTASPDNSPPQQQTTYANYPQMTHIRHDDSSKSINLPPLSIGFNIIELGKGGATDDPRIIYHLERNYLLAVERGDAGSVRQFLDQAKIDGNLNINCIDPLGRNSLLIAIENENIDLIRLLLEHHIETGDSLLYAINEENVEAVETIITHLDDAGKFNSETQGVEIGEHSAFTPDITPIILAAHRDNFEIINLLHNKRAFVPHPHDVRCDCKDCLQASSEDSLRFSRSRINSYRALSSPSLICIFQRDPLMYAFELSWELRRLANIENEFGNEYQELSQKCQKFAVDLLDQTRGSCELEIILNHDTSDRMVMRESTEHERMQLARLKLAIQMRQKRFVAHPNCQQLLASIWYEGLPGFRRRNYVFKILLILGVFLLFPFLSIVYLIAPKTTAGQLLRKPFVKFLCRSASYCVFLFLLILASQRINYDTLFQGDSSDDASPDPFASTGNGSMDSVLDGSNAGSISQSSFKPQASTSPVRPRSTLEPSTVNPIPSYIEVHVSDNDRKETRGPPPTPVEWAILAWVAGLVWAEVKQLWDVGLYEYCHNMWNILDFITNSLYIATMMLRVIAYIQVEKEISDGYGITLGRSLVRKDWDAWDPTLISECIFATANIFSSLKLVHMFTVNPHLGPLQISLGRMVYDILKFFFVYCLVLFAFACGLNQLFWYYATMRSKECAKGWSMKNSMLESNTTYDIITQNEMADLLDSCDPKYSSFANLFNTVETLFWAIFGLVDLHHLELKESHDLTEWAGKSMFGTYGVISVVVLLNMLIAMMSNSYQYISNQSDVEWKFARSKLWIEYFEEGGTIPPPFNIIPSPKSFYYIFRSICGRFKWSKHIHQAKRRSLRLQKILKAVSDKEKMYKRVMGNLVKRYVAFVQRQKQQSEGVSEDDVNEIKQDISAFRYELLEILKRNSFDTGHANIAQQSHARNKKKSAMAERRLMKSGFQLELESLPEFGSTIINSSRLKKEQIVGQKVGKIGPKHRVRMAPELQKTSSTDSVGGSSASSRATITSGVSRSKFSRLRSMSKRINLFKKLGSRFDLASPTMDNSNDFAEGGGNSCVRNNGNLQLNQSTNRPFAMTSSQNLNLSQTPHFESHDKSVSGESFNDLTIGGRGSASSGSISASTDFEKTAKDRDVSSSIVSPSFGNAKSSMITASKHQYDASSSETPFQKEKQIEGGTKMFATTIRPTISGNELITPTISTYSPGAETISADHGYFPQSTSSNLNITKGSHRQSGILHDNSLTQPQYQHSTTFAGSSDNAIFSSPSQSKPSPADNFINNNDYSTIDPNSISSMSSPTNIRYPLSLSPASSVSDSVNPIMDHSNAVISPVYPFFSDLSSTNSHSGSLIYKKVPLEKQHSAARSTQAHLSDLSRPSNATVSKICAKSPSVQNEKIDFIDTEKSENHDCMDPKGSQVTP